MSELQSSATERAHRPEPASSSGGGGSRTHAFASLAQGFDAQSALLSPVQARASTSNQTRSVQRRVVQRESNAGWVALGAVAGGIVGGPLGAVGGGLLADHLTDDGQPDTPEAALEDINSKFGMLRDVLSEMREAGAEDPLLGRLPPTLSNISRALDAAQYAQQIPSVVRAVQAVPRVSQTWRQLRENPTRANQMAAAQAIGDLVSNLGGVLSLLPEPVGSWAGILEQADGSFFRRMVALIDANPERWRRQGLGGEPGSDQTNPGNCRGLPSPGQRCEGGRWVSS